VVIHALLPARVGYYSVHQLRLTVAQLTDAYLKGTVTYGKMDKTDLLSARTLPKYGVGPHLKYAIKWGKGENCGCPT